MKGLVTFLKARLSERTTWAGIAAALTATTATIATLQEPKSLVVGLTIGIAISGVIAAILPSPGSVDGSSPNG